MSSLTTLAQLLSAYFPHGLPDDPIQSREMIRQALAHLLGQSA